MDKTHGASVFTSALLGSDFEQWGIIPQTKLDENGEIVSQVLSNDLLIDINPSGPLGNNALAVYPLCPRFAYNGSELEHKRVNPWLMETIGRYLSDPSNTSVSELTTDFGPNSKHKNNMFSDQTFTPLHLMPIPE